MGVALKGFELPRPFDGGDYSAADFVAEMKDPSKGE
jgi:hypothetical protein